MHNVGGAFADSPRKAKSSCFDISHLRVADVDGNVYRLLHQLVELRSEMMEKLDKLDPHAGSGPACPGVTLPRLSWPRARRGSPLYLLNGSSSDFLRLLGALEDGGVLIGRQI